MRHTTTDSSFTFLEIRKKLKKNTLTDWVICLFPNLSAFGALNGKYLEEMLNFAIPSTRTFEYPPIHKGHVCFLFLVPAKYRAQNCTTTLMETISSEQVAHSLWALAEESLTATNIREAILFLETICQSRTAFYPQTEVRTRLRLADLYLKYTQNIDHAKSHLDRAVHPFHSSLFTPF